jgi:hypothetical protein
VIDRVSDGGNLEEFRYQNHWAVTN